MWHCSHATSNRESGAKPRQMHVIQVPSHRPETRNTTSLSSMHYNNTTPEEAPYTPRSCPLRRTPTTLVRASHSRHTLYQRPPPSTTSNNVLPPHLTRPAIPKS